MRHTHSIVGCFLAGIISVLAMSSANGQQIHRNGFETREVFWEKGTADAPFRELAHDISESTARTGQYSEHLQITAEQGTYVYYTYPTNKAPLNEELSVSLHIKANRPGLQFMARLVLPRERNPNNLQEPLTTLLRGDTYQETSRWHRLELRKPAKLAKQQQQLMRAQFKRDLDFTDAYIDRLMLNLYAGPGLAEVWIDDLEIGPVIDALPFQTTGRQAGPVKLMAPGTAVKPLSRAAIVEMNRGQLLVNGKPFLFRVVRHSDTPLKALRDAGYNAIWFDQSVTPATIDEAIKLGFWLVPSLPVTADDPRVNSPENLRNEIQRFLDRDAVLFWDLGGGLTEEQTEVVSKAVQLIHSADPQRPLGADAWDGYANYSRRLDLVGAHRWPLMTGLELVNYRDWLNQRRLRMRSGTFTWTWVQTHLPDWFTAMVYDRPSAAAFSEPIGPQPEQIRLLTYTALASGARGIGFWSDRFLADSHQGRDRLLTIAQLNQEIRMLEPLLLTAEEPTWIDTSAPDVKAAVMRTRQGLLVLPIWLGQGGQFVPGQAAVANLSMVVPKVPVGTQAWEISPGDVHALANTERVVGGTKITLPEFGMTAAVVFTADNGANGLVAKLQDQSRLSRKLAAQWGHDLAEEEIAKVARVEEQLQRLGHGARDGQALLQDARKRVQTCVEAWNQGDFREAYLEAQRAVRPLRIMMRSEWEEAVKGLNGQAVASPYAVSYYTLPMHWQFMETVQRAALGSNLLPNGSFEVSAGQQADTWVPQETTLDDVEFVARRVSDNPQEGKQCLLLQINPKNLQNVPQALERTYLATHSPAVKLKPGTLVKISGWIRIPKPITASADGALLFDSAGGEPLAVRMIGPTQGWKQVVLYRKVPASGEISVTLALTGLGSVFFDDIRVEPLIANQASTVPGN